MSEETGKNWFYESNGEQKGPVTAKKLKELFKGGYVKSKDLAWQKETIKLEVGKIDFNIFIPIEPIGKEVKAEPLWYYFVDGDMVGPLEWEEAKALAQDGTIRAETLVWHYYPEWNAAFYTELFPYIKTPIPQHPPKEVYNEELKVFYKTLFWGGGIFCPFL